MQLILRKIPLPPSINKQLMVSRGRMIKTIEARKFSTAIEIYFLKNFREIERIKSLIPKDTPLKVDCIFVFHKDRLIGKKNQIKVLDLNNYLKSTLDAVVRIIDIDDKFYVEHHIVKKYCDNPKDEQVIVEIYPSELLCFEKLEI